jgi:hypothetical protein
MNSAELDKSSEEIPDSLKRLEAGPSLTPSLEAAIEIYVRLRRRTVLTRDVIERK